MPKMNISQPSKDTRGSIRPPSLDRVDIFFIYIQFNTRVSSLFLTAPIWLLLAMLLMRQDGTKHGSAVYSKLHITRAVADPSVVQGGGACHYTAWTVTQTAGSNQDKEG